VDALTLEIGEFQDVTVRVGADNLTAFAYDVTDMDAFGYVVAYGGKTSDQVLTLYNGGRILILWRVGWLVGMRCIG
jgi:hypothetical protein